MNDWREAFLLALLILALGCLFGWLLYLMGQSIQ